MKNLLINISRFIFARKIFHKLNLHIYKLALRNIGVLNSDSTQVSGEEFLLKNINENLEIKTVFDVGANEGGYAMLIKQFIPDCKIYCFEPGSAYKKLAKKKSKDIFTYNIGLADKAKSTFFYDFNKSSKQKNNYPESAMASIYKDVFTKFHREKPTSTKIKLNTLDNVVKKEKINKIDYLKIDTEGSEYAVIKGAMKTIMKNKISVIHFEFNEMNVYSRVYFRDFLEILPKYNFYRLMPSGFFPLDNYSPKTHEIFAFQNIVAIREDLDWN